MRQITLRPVSCLFPHRSIRLHVMLMSLCMTAGMLLTTVSKAVGQEKSKQLLAFRMKEYKTVHSHDTAQAESLKKTLTALKCDVSLDNHGGHIDVKWRTVVWKLLALDSNEQVEQWEKWLKDNGFETLHSRPAKAGSSSPVASGEHLEVVQYRATEWKTLHIHNAAEANEALAIYQALGCEAEESKHSGHTDLKVRCPEWREFEMPNHQSALGWEQYLAKAGFEAKHEHRH